MRYRVGQIMQRAGQLLPRSSSARLDIELLMCNVLHCDRGSLYASPEQEIPPDKINRFNHLLEQRKTGVPIAYLTGSREFWSMQLAVNNDTLIPRPETECLVEAVLAIIPVSARFKVADMGTGSGAIAIAIASERPGCMITATDKQVNALQIARNNAMTLKVNNIEFISSDWFTDISGSFDIIVSNPPYIPSADPHFQSPGIQCEPLSALDGGKDGMVALQHIISTSTGFLEPGGWLFVEHGFDQADAVQQSYKQAGFTGVTTRSDYAGLPRVTCGQFMVAEPVMDGQREP